MDAGRLRWANRRILGEYNNEGTPCQGEMARKFAKVTIWRQISGALSNKAGLCRFERVHARWQRKISDAKDVSGNKQISMIEYTSILLSYLDRLIYSSNHSFSIYSSNYVISFSGRVSLRQVFNPHLRLVLNNFQLTTSTTITTTTTINTANITTTSNSKCYWLTVQLFLTHSTSSSATDVSCAE